MKPSIRSSIRRLLSASKEKKIHVPSLSPLSLCSFNNALRMPTVLRDRLVRGERGDGQQKAGDGDDSGGEGEEKKERIGDYEWRETESVE